jgi:uncharacterized protein with FMN-binding domain
MKKILLIVGGCVLAVVIVVGIVMSNGLSEGMNVTLHGINLADVPDGIYTGTYNFKRWTNTVTVQVKDGIITAIKTVDDVFGASVTNASGEIFRRVIETQDTKIDAVSGATVTSKAYLKAIEDALKP